MSGPGYTRYETREDGTVMKVRWGDASWTTVHVRPHDTRSPMQVAQLLREAYLEGFLDRGQQIRDALGVKP